MLNHIGLWGGEGETVRDWLLVDVQLLGRGWVVRDGRLCLSGRQRKRGSGWGLGGCRSVRVAQLGRWDRSTALLGQNKGRHQ